MKIITNQIWLICLIMLSIPYNSNAQSDRWVFLDSFDKNTYIGTFYYDQTTIKYEKNYMGNNIVKIWIKRTYEFPNKNEDLKDMINSDITLCEVDCKGNRLVETYKTKYFNNGNNYSEDIYEEHKIVPGSIGEKIYNLFCK